VNTATTSKALVWRAIANTSYRERPNPQEIIPAAEIHVALIDIMGAVTAMMEESLPKDLQRWAEGLAAQFAASFHAARASLSPEELDAVTAQYAERAGL
jgi:hypothetical protein